LAVKILAENSDSGPGISTLEASLQRDGVRLAYVDEQILNSKTLERDTGFESPHLASDCVMVSPSRKAITGAVRHQILRSAAITMDVFTRQKGGQRAALVSLQDPIN
jgi:hypothetical protein